MRARLLAISRGLYTSLLAARDASRKLYTMIDFTNVCRENVNRLQHAKKPFFVGIDVGGTNIKIGLVDDYRPDAGVPLDAHRARQGRRRRLRADGGAVVKQLLDENEIDAQATSSARASRRRGRWTSPRA